MSKTILYHKLKTNDYKGEFFDKDKEKRYFEYGAHFKFSDLCERLEKIIRNTVKEIQSDTIQKEKERENNFKLEKKESEKIKNLNMIKINKENLNMLKNSVDRYSIEAKKKIETLMKNSQKSPSYLFRSKIKVPNIKKIPFAIDESKKTIVNTIIPQFFVKEDDNTKMTRNKVTGMKVNHALFKSLDKQNKLKYTTINNSRTIKFETIARNHISQERTYRFPKIDKNTIYSN